MTKHYCRFCNQKTATLFTSEKKDLYQIICPACATHSPVRKSENLALKAWTLMMGTKKEKPTTKKPKKHTRAGKTFTRTSPMAKHKRCS